MASEINGSAEIAAAAKSITNPYETRPQNIPNDDPFIARSPQYGRYSPHPNDFSPHYKQWYQTDPDTNAFWQEVARKFCTPKYSLNTSGPREAFAVGSVIIQVDREPVEGGAAERYSCANANELSSARKVDEFFRDVGVAVPVLYFCGIIEGRNVTVESRIPGVSLEVAWRYLSIDQIEILKNQCRQLLQILSMIDPSADEPSYVCSGLNSQPLAPGGEQERDVLFASKDPDEELSLTHNNLVPANIIVKDDRIVGITGWRECGYFGLARAKKVHRSLRDLGAASHQDPNGTIGCAPWVDLYDGIYDPSRGAPLAASEDTPFPSVKTEPTTSTLDRFPTSDDLETGSVGYDGGTDIPTSKKVANLKNGLTSRASSSDRSSPATSVKLATAKKAGSTATKKGMAKKPTSTKKRKGNDADADSLDGLRSNTPASRTGKPPGKKQDSASIAGSPAPEEKKKKKPKQKGKKTVTEENEEDYEDENEVFCICRRPDNHTWMIGCDGGCEDWFHGKCVNIDRRDSDLIDKYICPNCNQQGKGCTTWKPMCRLPECRKPARVTRKNPSKYCSDEHGQEFMRRQIRHLKLGAAHKGQEDLGSMGGTLTAGDLKAAVTGVSSVTEFRTLGDQIIPSAPATTSNKEDTPNSGVKTESDICFQVDSKPALDFGVNGLEYSADEAAKVEKLRKLREELLHRKEMLAARSTFISLLRQRSKGVVEKLKQSDPKGGWKDICGFDSRLSWSDEEFDEWRLSDAGKKALAEGTVEALAASYPATTDSDGDTAMGGEEENEITFLTRGVCTKKRCERHKQWVKVQQQDIVFEENATDQELAKYEQQARSVAERAVLRKWAEKENICSDVR